MEDADLTFGNQILISILGNFLTVGMGLIVWIVKEKCSHCESECNLPCCKIRARDQTRHTCPEANSDMSLSDSDPNWSENTVSLRVLFPKMENSHPDPLAEHKKGCK